MFEYGAYSTLELQSSWYKSMCLLHDSIFTTKTSESIREELSSRSKFLILVALHGDRVVGYKIGYEERKGRFYSWVGGVYPEYRGQGIASELTRRQHDWCESQGYTFIRTHTKNKWRDMLILNLRHGFNVIGTYTDELGEPKIILEKRLCRDKKTSE